MTCEICNKCEIRRTLINYRQATEANPPSTTTIAPDIAALCQHDDLCPAWEIIREMTPRELAQTGKARVSGFCNGLRTTLKLRQQTPVNTAT